MGHPADGDIRAFLDGEASGKLNELRAHLEACARCGARAKVQSRAVEMAGGALSLLDVQPDLERARARILGKEAEARRIGAKLRRHLPRAASFAILLTAGAAAALPGSPLRQWVTRGWEAVSGPGASGTAPALEETGGTEAASGLVGATIPVSSEGLELHLSGFGEDASLRILFVEGSQAGIFAGEGTRFRSETGRLVASTPPGDVTMEIPLQATLVSVVVNGETYLRRTGDGMEILGPVRTRTPTEIRFGPSEAGTNGPESGG